MLETVYVERKHTHTLKHARTHSRKCTRIYLCRDKTVLTVKKGGRTGIGGKDRERVRDEGRD